MNRVFQKKGTIIWLWIQRLFTGPVAGFICGLFGMGGGSLMVPAIVYVFNLPMK
ncbi:MAG: sulfite exporter TauE/SafE family protein [Candidatus Omnitrophica bacterium]|nr:sulfite exporter TauE/SafE family protein [Candidatus Omnitrophota bacterium]